MPMIDRSTEGGDDRVRVRIDHDLCSGTAHCQQSMRHLFVVADRKSWIRHDVDWSTVDVDDLQHTADACPWFAITTTRIAPNGPQGA